MKNILIIFYLILLSLSSQAQSERWYETTSPKGTPVYCFETIGNDLFAGVGGVGILKSDDLGESWTLMNEGLTVPYPSDLLNSNSKTIYASTYFGGVFKSDDLGESWQAYNEGLTDFHVTAIVEKSNTLYISTASGIFTMNKGENIWTKVKLPRSHSPSRAIHCLFVDGNTVLAGGTESLYFTSDNGKTWEIIHDVTTYNITDIAKKGNTLLLATSGDGILETNGNYRSWLKSQEFLGRDTAKAVSVLYPVDNNIVVKGTNAFGLFKGEEEFNEGLDNLEIRSIIRHKNKFFVGTFSDGILIFDSKSIGLRQRQLFSVDLSLRPNPADEEIQLKFNLIEKTILTIQIIAEDGRLVKTVATKEAYDQGVYTLDVKFSRQLAEGIYFCVMHTEQGQITKQFLINH